MIRAAALAALALILAQALVIGRVELTFDEAYYALWAHFPQAGYLDHPPLVAWIIAASMGVFGGGEFGVRALFWLSGALVPALIALLGWRLFADARAAAAAVLFWVAAPLVAGAPLATPDTPLVFFWTLALLGLCEVWRGRAGAWALVGLATGAAGLAKMSAGFLALGIVLALAATPSLRRQFARPGPWLAGALALAVLSPFLWWNAAHGYATLFKQGGRLAAARFAPGYLGEFVGVQLALFNPLTAGAAIFAALRLRARPSEPMRLLLATCAPALMYFVVHALHDRVQGNWPAPLYPAFCLIAARAVTQVPRLRWVPFAAAALGGAATVLAYLHLALGGPTLGPADPALRIGGWRELAQSVFTEARARDAGFVLAEGYAATSLLAFYGPADARLGELGEPERWTFRPAIDTRGAGLAFLRPAFADELNRRFAHVEPLQTLRRRVGAVELEPYALYWVSGQRR
ncbi:MAG: glycosyltransferase family 39 protein [Pseudomonadota bacterium]|nr:glycosyltransferase family 39 protein [Pseudomonadota bacterium]